MRESIAYDNDIIRKTVNKYLKHKPNDALAKGVATIQLFDENQHLIREIKSENIITDKLLLGIYANFCTKAFNINLGKVLSYNNSVFNTLILSTNTGPEEHYSVIKGQVIGYSMLDASYDSANDMSGFYNKKESKNEIISKSSIFGIMHTKHRWHMVFDFPDFSANGTFQTIYVADAKDSDEHVLKPYYCVRNSIYPLAKITSAPKDNKWYEGNIQKCDYDNGKFAILQKCDTTEKEGRDSDGVTTIFTLYLHLLDAKTGRYSAYAIDNTWYDDQQQAENISDVIEDSDCSNCNVHLDGINDIVYISYDSYQVNVNGFDCTTKILKIDLKNKKAKIFDTSSDISRFKGNNGLTNDDNKRGCAFYVKDGFLYNLNAKFDAEKASDRTSATLYLLRYNNQGVLDKYSSTTLDLKKGSKHNIITQKPLWLPTYCISPVCIDDKFICFDYECKYLGEQGTKFLNPIISFYDGDSTVEANAVYKKDLGAFISKKQYGTDDSNGIEIYFYFPIHPITHNRLPAPVTKTQANTMKIQYDLIYECINPEIIIPDWDK